MTRESMMKAVQRVFPSLAEVDTQLLLYVIEEYLKERNAIAQLEAAVVRMVRIKVNGHPFPVGKVCETRPGRGALPVHAEPIGESATGFEEEIWEGRSLPPELRAHTTVRFGGYPTWHLN